MIGFCVLRFIWELPKVRKLSHYYCPPYPCVRPVQSVRTYVRSRRMVSRTATKRRNGISCPGKGDIVCSIKRTIEALLPKRIRIHNNNSDSSSKRTQKKTRMFVRCIDYGMINHPKPGSRFAIRTVCSMCKSWCLNYSLQ